MKRKGIGLLVASTLAVGSASGITAWAADPAAHSHGHAVDAHAPKSNAGKKWASDEPLRQGMTKVRDAVDARLPAAHRGKLSATQYDVLGGEIDAQIAHIVQNCKLEPAADEALHAILAGMSEGNAKLQGKDPKARRSAGIVQVVRSLEQYAATFEHPGFQMPRTAH